MSPLKIVESFHKPQREKYSLSAEQGSRFRALVDHFGHEPGKPGPRNSRQIAVFIEGNVALPLHPSELLALYCQEISGRDTDKLMGAMRRTVVATKSFGKRPRPQAKDLSSMRDPSIFQFAAEPL